jgi:hypothetical protein
MFHKQYYKLDEAAKKLKTDIETIFHMAIAGKIDLSIPVKNSEYLVMRVPNNRLIIRFTDNPLKLDTTCGTNWIALASGEVESLYNGRKKNIFSDSILGDKDGPLINHRPTAKILMSLQAKTYTNLGSHKIFQHVISDGEEITITRDDLVVSNQELTRLKAIKAQLKEFKKQRDCKPTAEQLQQQLDEAKARIAELEAKPSTDTKQPIQQQREQALLFWVEGVGRDVVMTMPKAQIRDALKRIDPIFRFSDFEKFWQKQKVIKLEAGKPTRNIG